MPYKSGKLKGQLTLPELRKLIKAHNKLQSITIPPRIKRDELIKLIETNGFKINHEEQKTRSESKTCRKYIKETRKNGT
jgi:hypothetical protein